MPAEREKGQLAAGGAGRKICAHRHYLLERFFGPPTGIEVRVNASGHAALSRVRRHRAVVAIWWQREEGSGALMLNVT